MLKSCWDCLIGYSREQTDEVVYGTQLNGDSRRAPPWPTPVNENEIMYLLPRRLQIGDKIHINGIIRSNPNTFTVRLMTGQSSPDYSNIAFELEASFSSDQFYTRTIYNGAQDNFPVDLKPSHLIGSSGNFNISTTIRVSDYVDNPILDVTFGSSSLTQIELKHNLEDIRFLVLDGDVERVGMLQFEFS